MYLLLSEKKLKNIRLIIYILFIACFLCGCSRPGAISPHIYSGFYFDTYIQVTIYENLKEYPDDKISELLSYYDALFSESNNTSDIFKANASTNQVTLNEETIYLLDFMLNGAAETDGSFDPTIYSISDLWDFKNEIKPSDKDIESLLHNVSYNDLQISDNTLFKNNPEIKISLGAVAKGYISDRIYELLKKEGINNSLINLGGNVLVMGEKPDGSSFNVAIKKPFTDSDYSLILNLSDGQSLVTSGIYERYFEEDDIIYHHILDTSSGYPLNNGLYSVSVLGNNSMICDFLSTALFTLWENQTQLDAILEKYPDYHAVFILNDYSIVYSKGFPKEIIVK